MNVKLLIVGDGDAFISLLSIGDIQRAIIKGVSLNTPISEILRNKITICNENDSMETIKSLMLQHRTEFMPVLDKSGKIKDVIFWEDMFENNFSDSAEKLDLDVVIMAGGKGTRLQPLTNVIPKPLVPLGDKPMIEHIINSFVKSGMKKFFMLLNYKAQLIESYIKEINNNGFLTEFICEDKPLGTAGSLNLLKGKINRTFFVTNCDILIDQDYSEIYKFHKKNENELTIVGALKHYSIPYGTLEVETGGQLKDMKEKPEITFMINCGMYLLEPHLLDEVPEGKFFHITELIENVKSRNGKVGVFPLSEMSWVDIGDWKELGKTQEILLKKNLV